MTTTELHAHLLSRGLSLRVDHGRLIVSPSSQLDESDRGAIREHRDALIEAVTATPCNCLAPVICGQVGICGRAQCVVGEDDTRWSGRMMRARQPSNPHRVPDFDGLGDISKRGTAA